MLEPFPTLELEPVPLTLPMLELEPVPLPMPELEPVPLPMLELEPVPLPTSSSEPLPFLPLLEPLPLFEALPLLGRRGRGVILGGIKVPGSALRSHSCLRISKSRRRRRCWFSLVGCS